jgi:hypothetical protein
MPATPIATATTELPPPVHDLVPGNLTLASSGTGPATPSAPSLSSSLASQYDPASVDEEQDNLKDVSGVSTPIGTPRQAHRDLDDESSVADSNGKAEELDEKLKGLALDEDEGEGGKARENEDNGDSPLVVQRSPTPTLSESASQGGALFGAPLSATVSPEVLAAEEALKKAEDAATAAEDAVKPAEKAVTAAESSAVQSPAVPSFQSLPESVPATPVSASIKFDEEKTEEDASDKASQESTPTEATADSVSKSAKDTPAEKAAPAVPEPEAEKSEILDDEQDSDALAQSVELDRPRNSEDTLRPIESIRTGSDSAVATPIIPPADADSRSVKSLDRDATPQPPGDSDDERDVPALDDTSDIVSVGGGGPPSERGFENESSESTVAHDVSSNRSSMPPARASSELEFRYEEYADQFFRDQSGSGHDSATGAGAGAAAAAAATGVALGAATASAAHRSEETAAAASGSSGNTLQEPPARGNTGVSVEDEERRFPAVPTNNVDRASSSPHKPLQVHVEPSPYGPITDKQPKQPSSDPSSSEPTIISLNDTPAAVITIDPPASETDAPHTNFPAAPATDLPDPLTPSPSTLPSRTPTPPKRSSSLARTFPAVPDEQHPYVGVHLQEHRASTPTTPEHRLSADSERRPKRNSFTPRSPYLDDEDPGDFEPGEGWAVVTNWEPWRGSPTKQGQPLRPLSKPTSPVDKPLPSPISPDKPLPDTPAPPPQTPPGKGKNGKNGKRSSRKR